MQKHLLIDLSNLPEEGKSFAGELSPEIFDLPEGDAKAVGPLTYDLYVQRFGSELLLTGKLSAPFEFTCVRTLHPFVQTIFLEDAAVSQEITAEGDLDVTESIREEVLINFPVDPRCDDADEPQHCEIDSRYLAVDKEGADDVGSAPRAPGNDPWSQLDAIKNLTDEP